VIARSSNECVAALAFTATRGIFAGLGVDLGGG
jgi:hypothetical protein